MQTRTWYKDMNIERNKVRVEGSQNGVKIENFSFSLLQLEAIKSLPKSTNIR